MHLLDRLGYRMLSALAASTDRYRLNAASQPICRCCTGPLLLGLFWNSFQYLQSTTLFDAVHKNTYIEVSKVTQESLHKATELARYHWLLFICSAASTRAQLAQSRTVRHLDAL